MLAAPDPATRRALIATALAALGLTPPSAATRVVPTTPAVPGAPPAQPAGSPFAPTSPAAAIARAGHPAPTGLTFGQLRPLVDFPVGTGARYGEAAGLLVEYLHLDADRPYVDIRLALKWGGKKWKLGRPKTQSSIRRVLLTAQLVQVLRPLVAGKAPGEHVFTMAEGGPLHHGNFSGRYWREAVASAGAGVPRRLRIHDLRHTHAAWLLSDGVPAMVVAHRLGHSSTTTTLDVYGHITAEADNSALEGRGSCPTGPGRRDAGGGGRVRPGHVSRRCPVTTRSNAPARGEAATRVTGPGPCRWTRPRA